MSPPTDILLFTILTTLASFSQDENNSTQLPALNPLDAVPGTSESDLIRLLNIDDHTAFETIYRVLHPRLLAIATRYVHSVPVAEELVQDALLLVWDRRHQWKPTDSLVVYLYATVRNRALKHRRHERVIGRVATIARSEGQPLGAGNFIERPDIIVEREDLLAAVRRVLHSLPEVQQTAFTFRWIHHLSYDDIAEIMGISVVSARKHVSRARTALISVIASLTEA